MQNEQLGFSLSLPDPSSGRAVSVRFWGHVTAMDAQAGARVQNAAQSVLAGRLMRNELAMPTLAMLTVMQVARRALEHAVAKPGRELLYDRAVREVKLKGQNAVDTAVYRAGDMISGWAVAGLGALGVVGGGLLLVFVPIAIAWAWFARRIAPRDR